MWSLERSSQATITAEVKHGRQFFAYALRKKWINENPFSAVRTSKQVDKTRHYHISAADLELVIQKAPSLEWKTLVAIVRYTGCRVGEALALRWQDIVWESDRIKMPCPKTKRYGSNYRVIPLWPELKPFLRDLQLVASRESDYCIGTLVKSQVRQTRLTKNLGTQFKRNIEKAGLIPWPKPWQNIRCTRENELEQLGYRTTAIRAWIGHSEATAAKHYSDVNKQDFDLAMGQIGGKNEAQADAGNCNSKFELAINSSLLVPAFDCNSPQNGLAPPAGLEPATRRLTVACSTN